MSLTIRRLNVVDVESTCWAGRDAPESPVGSKRSSEIIEIGICCIRLASNTGNQVEPEIEHVEQYYIRPIWFPKLSEFCTSLTKIKQDTVDAAPLWPDVLNQIRKDYGKSSLRDNPWVSWGDYDRIMFDHMQENVWGDPDRPEQYRDMNLWGRQHINLKTLHAVLMGRSKPMDVSGALHSIGEKFEGVPHCGKDDAFNIAKIALWIINNSRAFDWRT